MNELKLALLIDAENISSTYIRTIIEESTGEGVITYKRIYGDWTKPNLKAWKEVLLEYAITPMQQYAYTTGKNSTDSAMIIDAMDILYTGKVDGFILVSSDSDFTKLAMRLKEAAMLVIGMGKQQTPKAFTTACTKFKFLDILSKEEDAERKPEKPDAAEEVTRRKGTGKPRGRKKEESSQTPLQAVVASVKKYIDDAADEDGWVLASNVGWHLGKLYPDFDVRNYHFYNLSALLKEKGFEIREVSAEGKPKLIYVKNPKKN